MGHGSQLGSVLAWSDAVSCGRAGVEEDASEAGRHLLTPHGSAKSINLITPRRTGSPSQSRPRDFRLVPDSRDMLYTFSSTAKSPSSFHWLPMSIIGMNPMLDVMKRTVEDSHNSSMNLRTVPWLMAIASRRDDESHRAWRRLTPRLYSGHPAFAKREKRLLQAGKAPENTERDGVADRLYILDRAVESWGTL